MVMENNEGHQVAHEVLKEIEIAKAKALLEKNGIFVSPENKN